MTAGGACPSMMKKPATGRNTELKGPRSAGSGFHDFPSSSCGADAQPLAHGSALGEIGEIRWQYTTRRRTKAVGALLDRHADRQPCRERKRRGELLLRSDS